MVEKTLINGVTENSIEFKQNSRGGWYCNGFILYGKDINELLEQSKEVMQSVNKVLTKTVVENSDEMQKFKEGKRFKN